MRSRLAQVGGAFTVSSAVAVRLAADLRPDVVLMDLRLPDLDGVEATRRIVAAGVLVLTTYNTDADIARAVAAGATGYVLKDSQRQELTAAVRAATGDRAAAVHQRDHRESHVTRIFEKLSVNDRTAAVTVAIAPRHTAGGPANPGAEVIQRLDVTRMAIVDGQECELIRVQRRRQRARTLPATLNVYRTPGLAARPG
jgi:CheY-like chemotaxis protein